MTDHAVEAGPLNERDIAAVAVHALSEASLAGADFVLTGPTVLSHARQVAVIGEVLGPRLAFHELSPEDFQARDGRQLAEARTSGRLPGDACPSYMVPRCQSRG